MSKLIGLKELSEILNYSESEILDLCKEKRIPHLIFHETEFKFPLEEVLAIIKPRPKEEKPITKKVIRKSKK